MHAVAARFERGVDPCERLRRHERAQQFVVARCRLVRAADDRVDNAQAGRRTDPVVGDARTGGEPARPHRGVLERARDRRAERDDATAAPLRCSDRGDGRRRHAVGLVERQACIELGVAGRRQSGGVGQRREADAACCQAVEQVPVEHESGRRRLERSGYRSDPRPDVPEREP